MFSSLLGVSSDTGGKRHKHRVSHGGRRNASSHSKANKTARSHSLVNSRKIPSSFLFVVNEFQVDYEPPPGQDQPLTDQWLNIIPPQHAAAYVGEVTGTVFRYQDGIVSPAHGYLWNRPEMGLKGQIVRVNYANVIDGYPAVYKSQTVFACSPLLGMVVTDGDASLGYTFPRPILCSCRQTYDEGECSTWSHLHFGSGNGREGISYVNSYAGGDPFVAGTDPSWIPALVPSVYRNTKPSIGPSRGLSGELPIVLALMAFHGKPGGVSDVFRERNWEGGQWLGPSRPSSYLPKSEDSPRGLFIQVCADNLVDGQEDSEENNIPMEVWEKILQDLEYRAVLVRG